MFGHGAHGPRVRRNFHNWQDGVTNNIALASRESVHDKTSGRHQGHALSRSRRRIHKIETRSFFRLLGGTENIYERNVLADFLQVAKCLFLDCGKAALDISFCWLTVGKIRGFVGLDNVILIGLERLHELLANLRAYCALCTQMFCTGKF